MNLEDFFKSTSGGCENPACTNPHETVVLHARCHMDAPTWVQVNSKQRKITVHCSVCNTVIAQIESPILN